MLPGFLGAPPQRNRVVAPGFGSMNLRVRPAGDPRSRSRALGRRSFRAGGILRALPGGARRAQPHRRQCPHRRDGGAAPAGGPRPADGLLPIDRLRPGIVLLPAGRRMRRDRAAHPVRAGELCGRGRPGRRRSGRDRGAPAPAQGCGREGLRRLRGRRDRASERRDPPRLRARLRRLFLPAREQARARHERRIALPRAVPQRGDGGVPRAEGGRHRGRGLDRRQALHAARECPALPEGLRSELLLPQARRELGADPRHGGDDDRPAALGHRRDRDRRRRAVPPGGRSIRTGRAGRAPDRPTLAATKASTDIDVTGSTEPASQPEARPAPRVISPDRVAVPRPD